MRRAAIILAALLAAAPVCAQQISGLGLKDPNAPIHWSADHFSTDVKTKTATFTGNVIVRQGEINLHADWMQITVTDNKPDKIFARGHVVIDAPSGIATGDSAVYDVNPRLVTLQGHVVLTRQQNVMSGSLLKVNLITGIATLNGGAQEGGRVQGLFTTHPNDRQNP